MTTGIIGVPLGSYLSQRLSIKYPQADPYICAAGLILSAPLLLGVLFAARVNIIATYALIFFAELALNLNWAIVADILLYVVVPTRRSTAEAFQILISHAFGDAGSPYFVGLMSEAIKRVIRVSADAYSGFEAVRPAISMRSLSQLAENVTVTTLEVLNTTTTTTTTTLAPSMDLTVPDPEDDSPLVKFRALQYALFSTCFVEILGGVFFMMTAIYIVRDRQRVDQAISANQSSSASAHRLEGSVSDMEDTLPSAP